MVSHPSFRPHPIQGTSPDFISKLAADAVRDQSIDAIVPVNGADALRRARDLALVEGLFCGISSGATVAAALTLSETAPRGSTILCMLADTGERYLSTPLFENIAIDMTEEEQEIASSTPARPLVPVTDGPKTHVPASRPDLEADRLIAAALDDVAKPVVMFALEWCEFCWSVRRLFGALSIPFRSIDLDSTALQRDDLGGRVRAGLRARTGEGTIPQVFIGGACVGGCTDVFEAARTGRLADRLRLAGVPFKDSADVDLRALMPAWVKS